MPKKSKLSTPEWILEGYDSPEEYEKTQNKKEKNFKIRICPECNSERVNVVVGEVGIWECKKCKWKGKEIKTKELTEEKFLEHLDRMEEKE